MRSEKICVGLGIFWGAMAAHFWLGSGGITFNVDTIPQMIPIALLNTLFVISWMMWFAYNDVEENRAGEFKEALFHVFTSGIGVCFSVFWLVFVLLPFISLIVL